MHRRTPLLMLAAAGVIVATASAPGQTPTSTAYLFNVNRNQTFTEIGSDDKTKPEFVEDFKDLAGKAVKVAFFKSDSVGDRVAEVRNWTPFATLQFGVFNPGEETVMLGLNILHAGSTNYATPSKCRSFSSPPRMRSPLTSTSSKIRAAPLRP